MRGRPFEVTWRQEDTTEALKGVYRRERDIELRTRLHGLWLLRTGRRLSSVAATVGVHYRTVQTWVAWYREGGLPNVLSHKMGGKGQEPFLSDEAQEQVAEEVATGRFRTAGEIREWIAEQYGVIYKEGGIYSLTHRLRCAPRVPGPSTPRPTRSNKPPGKRGAPPSPYGSWGETPDAAWLRR